MKIKLNVLFPIFFLVYSFNSIAQEYSWVNSNGPIGGEVSLITVNPDNGHLFSAKDDILYRSVDNGNSWSSNNTGLESVQFGYFAAGSRIVFNPVSKAILIVSVDGSLYTSANEMDWVKKGNGIQINYMVVKPNGRLFAVVDQNKISYSDDDGSSWTPVTNLQGSPNIGQLLVKQNGTLIAVTFSGIFNSKDGNGSSWEKGIYPPVNQQISGISSTQNGDIFVSLNCGGVYRSTDDGKSWTEFNTGLGQEFNCLHSIMITSDGTQLAGVYQGGVWSFKNNSWVINNNGFPEYISSNRTFYPVINWMAENASGDVFAATDNGLFRFMKNGLAWEKIGLVGAPVSSLLLDHSGVLRAAGAGVARYSEQTKLWTDNSSGLTYPSTNRIIESKTNNRLWVVTSAGPFYSDDGDTWNKSVDGIQNTYLSEVAINQTNGNLYVIPNFVSVNSAIVSKSNNNGQSWSPIQISTVTDFDGLNCIAVNSSDNIFVGTIGVLHRYINNQWNKISNMAFNKIFVHPVNSYLFATVLNFGYQLSRSTDNGSSWDSLTAINANNFSTDAEGNIFVSSNDGIFLSTDMGDHWNKIFDEPSTAIFADLNNTIYAATNKGVFIGIKSDTYISDNEKSELEFRLLKNYPNPFNPETKIKVSFSSSLKIKVEVFNFLGQKIQSLFDGYVNKGVSEFSFKAENIPSGIYLYKISSRGKSETGKMILMK